MTTKEGRKKQRIQKKLPRQNPKLSQVEAQVLFIIWKSGSPVTYAEIASRFGEHFGIKKTKDTVKVITNKIKQLEKATRRKYLHDSGGKPKTYAVAEKHFVNRKRSAVVLLELDKGYEHFSPDKPLEGELRRDGFEHYMFLTYQWDPSFTNARINDAAVNGYVSLDVKVEAGRPFINIEDRLHDDIDYLKLLVEDYCTNPRENPPPSIIAHMSDLLGLYRSCEKPSGGNA